MGLLRETVDDIGGAWARASMVSALRAGYNATEMRELAATFGDTLQSFLIYEAAITGTLKFGFGTDGQNAFVFIVGAQSQGAALSIANAYKSSVEVQNAIGTKFQTTEYYRSVANRIMSYLDTFPVDFQRLFFVGHSAGGSAAHLLAAMQLPGDLNDLTRVGISFGAPAFGYAEDKNVSINGSFREYCNTDDVVPYIPPPISSLDRFFAGISIAQARQIALYGIWGPAAMITETSNVQWGWRPALSGAALQRAFDTFISQPAGDLNLGPHAIQVYRTRLEALNAYLRANPRPATLPFATPPPIGPQQQPIVPATPVILPLTQSQTRSSQDAVVANIFHSPRNPSSPSAVVTPKINLLYAVRRGDWYVVEYQGTPIAMAKTRRGAHSLARIGNAWFKWFQNMGFVMGLEAIDAFSDFLITASDPQNGFFPPVNSNFSP